MVDLFNESFDLLINGSILDAAVRVNEQATTFGNVIWIWPIIFLVTLVLLAVKSENPTMVGIYVLLGTIALKARLPSLTTPVFAIILIFSLLMWLYSFFISPRTE